MSMSSIAASPGPRERILDAAEELFARRGYSGIGMREVAETAGLGKSSLFHHFHSKAELYLAVALGRLEAFEQRLNEALAAGGSPRERLDRWIDTVIDMLADDDRAARLLLRSLFEEDDADLAALAAADPRADASTERIIRALARLLHEGIEAGEFRPASIPHTVQSIIGLTVYPFASGDFGDQILGRSPFSRSEVKRRKQEVRGLLHGGIVARDGDGRSD